MKRRASVKGPGFTRGLRGVRCAVVSGRFRLVDGGRRSSGLSPPVVWSHRESPPVRTSVATGSGVWASGLSCASSPYEVLQLRGRWWTFVHRKRRRNRSPSPRPGDGRLHHSPISLPLSRTRPPHERRGGRSCAGGRPQLVRGERLALVAQDARNHAKAGAMYGPRPASKSADDRSAEPMRPRPLPPRRSP